MARWERRPSHGAPVLRGHARGSGSALRRLPRSASTVLLGELHAERLEVRLVRGDLFAFEGNRDPWFAALETFCDDPLCQQELQELESKLWAAILAAAREGIGKFFKLRGEVHPGIPSVLI